MLSLFLSLLYFYSFLAIFSLVAIVIVFLSQYYSLYISTIMHPLFPDSIYSNFLILGISYFFSINVYPLFLAIIYYSFLNNAYPLFPSTVYLVFLIMSIPLFPVIVYYISLNNYYPYSLVLYT